MMRKKGEKKFLLEFRIAGTLARLTTAIPISKLTLIPLKNYCKLSRLCNLSMIFGSFWIVTKSMPTDEILCQIETRLGS